MALLKLLDSDTLIYLKPVHIFGRDPSVADTVLDHDSCSRMHCVMRWQAGMWFVTDESRNGCYVNGKRIAKGSGVNLTNNDVLTIGKNEDVKWVMANDHAPKPILLAQDGKSYIELSDLNILPNEERPECQILKQGESWVFEHNEDHQTIKEKFECNIDGKQWVFFPNDLIQETKFYEKISDEKPKLCFHVSRNEEHIQLTFELGGKCFDLGHKTHHYLLLEMARHQLEDSTTSVKELGWMSNELLLNNMRIDINHLNIQIYRARAALKKCSSQGGQQLIERRRGEMRLKPCTIEIVKEG